MSLSGAVQLSELWDYWSLPAEPYVAIEQSGGVVGRRRVEHRVHAGASGRIDVSLLVVDEENLARRDAGQLRGAEL